MDPERVRNLITLDAQNLMTRLRTRRPEIISLFSRSRDRDVLVRTLRSWFEHVGAEPLLQLEPEHQSAVSAFYEAVDGLRFYFHYTEDMPGTVDRTLTVRMTELETHYRRLTRALGGPVPVDLADLQDVTPPRPVTGQVGSMVAADVAEVVEVVDAEVVEPAGPGPGRRVSSTPAPQPPGLSEAQASAEEASPGTAAPPATSPDGSEPRTPGCRTT